ncbi:MAG: hypothetical protein JWO83_787 [Caulobacteraceae bacterium]|jgi:uncharacterized protein (DUF4415 family)|nr:hypothetical protein [Caulobacteraceae bacterium]
MPTSRIPDPDNPDWTEDDFGRAKGPECLPAEVLAAFPNTVARLARTRGRAGSKRLQTMRLDPDVLDYFKGEGPGWQARINAVLRAAMERGR